MKLESILSERGKDSESDQIQVQETWSVRGNLETNPTVIKTETESHMTE